MKKIILGTLVMLTIGMGFGFAQTQKKNDTETKAQTQKKNDTETKSKAYYKGYNNAAKDYGDKKYNPNSCDDIDASWRDKQKYECIRGYQDSWERNSEVAPRTPSPNENSNNQ